MHQGALGSGVTGDMPAQALKLDFQSTHSLMLQVPRPVVGRPLPRGWNQKPVPGRRLLGGNVLNGTLDLGQPLFDTCPQQTPLKRVDMNFGVRIQENPLPLKRTWNQVESGWPSSPSCLQFGRVRLLAGRAVVAGGVRCGAGAAPGPGGPHQHVRRCCSEAHGAHVGRRRDPRSPRGKHTRRGGVGTVPRLKLAETSPFKNQWYLANVELGVRRRKWGAEPLRRHKHLSSRRQQTTARGHGAGAGRTP